MMKKINLWMIGMMGALGGVLGAADEISNPAEWPQWRGPLGNGVSPSADPPVEWSESKHVKWKVKIPGSGSSTPIVSGNKVFVTTAIPMGEPSSATPRPEPPAERDRSRPPGGGGRMRSEIPTFPYRFVLMCLDRATGRILWQATANEVTPHEGHHQDHGFASQSPVTDGERVYAYFGSRGLHAFDLEGNRLWSKDLGKMQTRAGFGEGSSPVLAGEMIVVNWDHEGEDFIVALDKRTGAERWRQERDEPTSWATPLAVQFGGRTQIVVSGTNRIRSYELETGKQLWECGGMTMNVIPTPLEEEGVVYVASGFRGNAVLAIQLGKSGDLTGTDAVLWSHDSRTPYVPSPLLYQGRLYFFSHNTGMLTAVDAKTGAVVIDAERVPDLTGVYASPVAAADKIYLTGRNGEVVVLRPGNKVEVLAANKLAEKFDASPAVAGQELYLRGREFLYCLSAAK